MITKNEMRVSLVLFKDINTDYNANNLSKKIGLTSMGTLKILKNLEKQNVLKARQLWRAVFYKPNLDNDFTKTYLKFILQEEAEQAIPRVKRWVKELRQVEAHSEIGILFGSVLKEEKYNDVDVLFVLKKSQNKKANKNIAELKQINIKRIQVVKQTKNDFKSNLKKKDKIILEILKRVMVLFGYDELIEVIENVS